MKRIALLLFALVLIVSCEETESPTVDPVNGQVALGFEATTVDVTVPAEGVTVTVSVLSATRTSADRSIPVSVDASSSGTAADYQLGSVVIPAGEHIGELTVTFGNFEGLTDCVTNTLVLNLESGSEGINGPQQMTFNYVKEFICPDLFLNITFDDYPGETTWQVADESGAVVAAGGPYAGETSLAENLCLCAGTYTFTIFDAFGDGICCGYGNGSYEVVFEGNVLFSGGEFGEDASHTFSF